MAGAARPAKILSLARAPTSGLASVMPSRSIGRWWRNIGAWNLLHVSPVSVEISDGCDSNRHSSMSRSEFGTFEEIIEAPNAVPSIPILLEHDVMPSSVIRMTVVFGQQVDQITLLRGARFQVKAYL